MVRPPANGVRLVRRLTPRGRPTFPALAVDFGSHLLLSVQDGCTMCSEANNNGDPTEGQAASKTSSTLPATSNMESVGRESQEQEDARPESKQDVQPQSTIPNPSSALTEKLRDAGATPGTLDGEEGSSSGTNGQAKPGQVTDSPEPQLRVYLELCISGFGVLLAGMVFGMCAFVFIRAQGTLFTSVENQVRSLSTLSTSNNVKDLVFSLGTDRGLQFIALVRLCESMGGLALCFLGFSLLVLGITQRIDFAGRQGGPSGMSLRIFGLSPGVVTILAGAMCMADARREFRHQVGTSTLPAKPTESVGDSEMLTSIGYPKIENVGGGIENLQLDFDVNGDAAVEAAKGNFGTSAPAGEGSE
jgi:hypothetical protein